MELLNVKACICDVNGHVSDMNNIVTLKINPNLVDVIEPSGKIYLRIDNERVLKAKSGKAILHLQGLFYTDIMVLNP